jgi:hypothetical protein
LIAPSRGSVRNAITMIAITITKASHACAGVIIGVACCCQSELAFPLLGKLVLMVDHPSIILPTICPVTDTKPRLPMSFLAIF